MSVALVREVVPDYATLTLEELGARIEASHRSVEESVSESMERAIATGDLLLEARRRIEHGQWEEWLVHNSPGVSMEWARLYMRIARNQELIRREKPTTIKGAGRLLRVSNVPDVRYDPLIRADAIRLHGEGMLHREIARELAVSKATISRWLNPAQELKYKRRRASTSRSGRAALKRQERKNAAKKVGGDLGEGYSLVRLALDTLERAALAHTGETKRDIRSAMTSLYNAEDMVARAIRNVAAAR